MIAQLRAEAYKLLTTRTTFGILAAMVGLLSLALAMHAFELPASTFVVGAKQTEILSNVAVMIGMVFAALMGALAITSEYRTGTIRPTLLASPRRGIAIGAKAACALAAGAVTGLLAAGTAAGALAVGLNIRGVDYLVSSSDLLQLLGGTFAGGALMAVVGLGLGAVIRAQVPTVIGLVVWLLFVEQAVLGDVPNLHKFAPGALAQAIAGATRDGILTSTGLAALLLAGYALIATAAGIGATMRRDVA